MLTFLKDEEIDEIENKMKNPKESGIKCFKWPFK